MRRGKSARTIKKARIKVGAKNEFSLQGGKIGSFLKKLAEKPNKGVIIE